MQPSSVSSLQNVALLQKGPELNKEACLSCCPTSSPFQSRATPSLWTGCFLGRTQQHGGQSEHGKALARQVGAGPLSGQDPGTPSPPHLSATAPEGHLPAPCSPRSTPTKTRRGSSIGFPGLSSTSALASPRQPALGLLRQRAASLLRPAHVSSFPVSHTRRGCRRPAPRGACGSQGGRWLGSSRGAVCTELGWASPLPKHPAGEARPPGSTAGRWLGRRCLVGRPPALPPGGRGRSGAAARTSGGPPPRAAGRADAARPRFPS